MPITWHEYANEGIAQLEGDVDVACSGEMKRLLIEAFSSNKAVRVDLSLAGDLDITAIQLLWASQREAQKTKRSFTVKGKLPQALDGMLREIGFENFLLTEERWL